jgi:hypothetical protein
MMQIYNMDSFKYCMPWKYGLILSYDSSRKCELYKRGTLIPMLYIKYKYTLIPDLFLLRGKNIISLDTFDLIFQTAWYGLLVLCAEAANNDNVVVGDSHFYFL